MVQTGPAGAVHVEHVGRDAVQEPAVVGHHEGRAGEHHQGLLERAQRREVEVVGGLVERDEVPALEQELREHHAPALAAREGRERRVPHARVEAELVQEALDADGLAAHVDDVAAAGDVLRDREGRVERAALLIDAHELHRLADLSHARVGFEGAGEDPQQVDLPAPFGPMIPSRMPAVISSSSGARTVRSP